MQTFQEFLEAEEKRGVIDFRVRIVRAPNGDLDFYIHPAGVDGATADFSVAGNKLVPIPAGHCAGSRPEKG